MILRDRLDVMSSIAYVNEKIDWEAKNPDPQGARIHNGELYLLCLWPRYGAFESIEWNAGVFERWGYCN
jgi:hypothetical protein